jgi:hypothetical protein
MKPIGDASPSSQLHFNTFDSNLGGTMNVSQRSNSCGNHFALKSESAAPAALIDALRLQLAAAPTRTSRSG